MRDPLDELPESVRDQVKTVRDRVWKQAEEPVEAISKNYELYLECKAIGEGTTGMLGRTCHVRLLWAMLEAAREEIAELQEKASPYAGDPYD